jgi:hypothetical protein
MTSNKVYYTIEALHNIAHSFDSQNYAAPDSYPVEAMASLNLHGYSYTESDSYTATSDGPMSSPSHSAPRYSTLSPEVEDTPMTHNSPDSQPELWSFGLPDGQVPLPAPKQWYGRDPNYTPTQWVEEDEDCPKAARRPGTAAYYKRKKLERMRATRQNTKALAILSVSPEAEDQKKTGSSTKLYGKAKLRHEKSKARYNARMQRSNSLLE